MRVGYKAVNESAAVKEWMLAVRQQVPDLPIYPDVAIVKLRIKLIQEEVEELLTTLYKIENKLTRGGFIDPTQNKLSHLVDLADAVADSIYVISGTATAFGLDAERVFELVHAANMAKLGGPVREDGKQLKPVGWQPPEPAIAALITNAWANAAPHPVVQRDGVDFEGPLDAAPS